MAAYIAHLIIATAMAPSLIVAAPSRIVSLTSSGHKISPVHLDDLNFETRPYDGLSSYGQAKTAASLLAVALNARLAARGVLAFAVHPGVILDTGLSRHVGGVEDEKARVEEYGIPPEALKSIPAGAATTVWAATSPDLAASGGGKYCEDCHISEPADGGGAFSGVLDYAVDPAIADQLWVKAEAMLGRSLTV